MRKLQTNPALANHNIIACMGDSQTSMLTPYGVAPYDVWGAKLAQALNADGALSTPKIFGVPGNTTAMMTARMGAMGMYGKPVAACISAGVNDAAMAAQTGTAQTGSASTTIKLASGASAIVGDYVAQVISITSGTGSGQSRTISAYDPTTKIATVTLAWTTTPDNTSVYSIGAPTQAVMQANIQAMVKCLKYAAYGDFYNDTSSPVVYSQTMLPALGKPNQRYVVLSDNSSTGGVAKWANYQNNNITTNYSARPVQSVWEWRTSLAGEAGWGRVAITGTPVFSDGVAKIMVLTQSYLNFTSGAGDNYNVTANTGTQYSAYIPVRAACIAAASAESVKLCDVYAYQSMLIYGGTFEGKTITPECAQNDNKWHCYANNQHYNTFGHGTVARAAYMSAVADGWVTVLSQ